MITCTNGLFHSCTNGCSFIKARKNLGVWSENVYSFIRKNIMQRQQINLMYTIIQKNIYVAIHKIKHCSAKLHMTCTICAIRCLSTGGGVISMDW